MGREAAIIILKATLDRIKEQQDEELTSIFEARDEVLGIYQPILAKTNLKKLTAEQFKSFLLFKNNRHWKAIHRQANQIVADMPALRKAFGILLDEQKPLVDRLKKLRPKGKDPLVKGLARSVITPILLVAHPKKYGVLNQVAEDGMKQLGVWPALERGSDFAGKYVAVNKVLNELASELGIDLWTLDALWWRVAPEEKLDDTEVASGRTETTKEQIFGLERHLHDFLRDNWDQTELGKEWMLIEEDGEIVGYEYDTHKVGVIDLLAKHRTAPKWLVVELKRGHTSDKALGQALRYRGWVKRHLAEPNESVEAVVVGHQADQKLLYALDDVPGVRALTYSVTFSLETPRDPWKDDKT